MAIVYLILGVIVAVSGFSGYFIGAKVRTSLVKAENKNAAVYGVISGLVSFMFILGVIFYLLVTNVPFHR